MLLIATLAFIFFMYLVFKINNDDTSFPFQINKCVKSSLFNIIITKNVYVFIGKIYYKCIYSTKLDQKCSIVELRINAVHLITIKVNDKNMLKFK